MKNERVNKTYFNFTELVTETFALLQPQAEKKKVKLTTYQAEPFTIFADKDMVKIVIRNLIHNAIKYSYQNGLIIINVISAKKSEEKAIIIVRDNGKGISPENQKKLFGLDHYSTSGTAYEQGSGVGLLLCKDFIEKNGGKIWVESELNKGATFCFSIPTHETTVK
jgi:signal transduction histidine kinase